MDELPRKKKKNDKEQSTSKDACGNEAETKTKSRPMKDTQLKELQNDKFSADASPVLFPCDVGIILYPDPCKDKQKKTKRKNVEVIQADDVCQESVKEADGEKRRKKKKHKRKSHNCVGKNDDETTQTDTACDISNTDALHAGSSVADNVNSQKRNMPDEHGKAKRCKKGKKKSKRHDNSDEVEEPNIDEVEEPNIDEVEEPNINDNDVSVRDDSPNRNTPNAKHKTKTHKKGTKKHHVNEVDEGEGKDLKPDINDNDVSMRDDSPNRNTPNAKHKTKTHKKGTKKTKEHHVNEVDGVDEGEGKDLKPDFNDNDVSVRDDSPNRNIPNAKHKTKTHKKGTKKTKEHHVNSNEVGGKDLKPDINDNDICNDDDNRKGDDDNRKGDDDDNRKGDDDDLPNGNTSYARHTKQKHKKSKQKTKEHDTSDEVDGIIEASDINDNVETKTKRKHKNYQERDDDFEINTDILKHKHKRKKQNLIGSADSDFSSCISLKNGTTDKIANEQENPFCTAKKKRKRRDKDELQIPTNCEPELKMATKAKEVFMNQWETAQFDDSGRQQKFMRLLGGFKKSNSGESSSTKSKTAMGLSKEKEFSKKLENQFNKAMTWNVGGQKGSGLGFLVPLKEGKKFHIDTSVSKSKKFDE